jgi:phosphoribosylglycinamide formyltransferase-1
MDAPAERPHRRPRLVVMVSGSGTNLQAVLDAVATQRLDAEVVAVVSDRAGVRALERAAAAGVPAVHVGAHAGERRADYDARLADVVAGFDPDWIVLAGWMRILTMSFLGWFPGRVLNLHPALPGELPGIDAIGRAWEEARDGRRSTSGVMVHLVPDEGVDDGPVLGTRTVPIEATTKADFEASMHAAEHALLVEVLADLCGGGERPGTGPGATPDSATGDSPATTPRNEVPA